MKRTLTLEEHQELATAHAEMIKNFSTVSHILDKMHTKADLKSFWDCFNTINSVNGRAVDEFWRDFPDEAVKCRDENKIV